MKSTLLECQRYLYVVLVLLFPIISYSQTPSEIKIGTQIWTSKNLDVSNFSNGDPIPEANSSEEWIKASENERPAFCYYNFDINNGKVYGKLYNWYVVNDPRGLAPKGYHIPSYEEWTILINILGGEDQAGEKLKNKQGWKKNEKKSGNGNNRSGFNGLPGGNCTYEGVFQEINYYGTWWSSTHDGFNVSLCRSLLYHSKKIIWGGYTHSCGLSVRCIKD
jgi:uncharacterized protein (TIGR02145 family)